jgi:hypothetical protein
VTLKLQGLPLLFGASADRMEPWVRSAVRIFGPQRCMFAAHFPIDRLLRSYDELIQALLAILDDLTGGEREAFFSGCAVREYQPSARRSASGGPAASARVSTLADWVPFLTNRSHRRLAHRHGQGFHGPMRMSLAESHQGAPTDHRGVDEHR